MASYREAFPDFPVTDWPAVIPAGFVDTSWRNDACPSLTDEARGVRIWVDYSDASKSEVFAPTDEILSERDALEHKRFCVALDTCQGDPLLETNDWVAVLAFVAAR